MESISGRDEIAQILYGVASDELTQKQYLTLSYPDDFVRKLVRLYDKTELTEMGERGITEIYQNWKAQRDARDN